MRWKKESDSAYSSVRKVFELLKKLRRTIRRSANLTKKSTAKLDLSAENPERSVSIYI